MLKRKFFTCLLVVSAYISMHAQNAGNALHFDGSNDNVTTPVPTLFTNTNTNNFTIEAWIYPQGNTLSRVLFCQHNSSNLVTFTLSTNRQVYLYVVVNGNTYGKLTYASLPANQWTHVALTWTASSRTTKIYFNGVDQNGTTSVGTTSTGNNAVMTLGSRSDAGGNQFFTGSLDELRIWNYVRSNCEILGNKNATLAGTENGLVSLYKFNEGSAGENNMAVTTLVNSVASATNGTLMNFALSGSTSNWISSNASINQQGAQTGLTVNQSVNICSGESYTFPDGTTQENITAAVTHISSFTSSLQCDSSVVTSISIKPIYAEAENVQLCAGESYTFPDGTTQYNITSPVTYVSDLNSQNSCDSTMTTHIQITTVNASVTQGGVLLSAIGTGNYQWINCSTLQSIAGANAQTYAATANGSYAVQVSVGNCVDTSACLTINTVNINESDLSNLSIYPNPSNGNFTVTLPNAEQGVELKIIDVNGRLLMNEFYNQPLNMAVAFEAPAGLYILLVRLRTGEQATFHIIKQ